MMVSITVMQGKTVREWIERETSILIRFTDGTEINIQVKGTEMQWLEVTES